MFKIKRKKSLIDVVIPRIKRSLEMKTSEYLFLPFNLKAKCVLCNTCTKHHLQRELQLLKGTMCVTILLGPFQSIVAEISTRMKDSHQTEGIATLSCTNEDNSSHQTHFKPVLALQRRCYYKDTTNTQRNCFETTCLNLDNIPQTYCQS